MKKEYERAEIDFILLDFSEDIITASGTAGSFGGDGEDVGGWT